MNLEDGGTREMLTTIIHNVIFWKCFLFFLSCFTDEIKQLDMAYKLKDEKKSSIHTKEFVP
jgi:hypothetical protein